jgi:hypothetical protein
LWIDLAILDLLPVNLIHTFEFRDVVIQTLKVVGNGKQIDVHIVAEDEVTTDKER